MLAPILEHIQQQYAFFDLFTSGWVSDYCGSGGTIPCRKGCYGCCNLTVNTTFAEALLVAHELTDEQAEAARRHAYRLREWADQAGDLKEYLRFHRSDDGFCPFLGSDGACGIYRYRPLSCRSLISTKESRWCATDFAALSPAEKEQFISSLDRSVVGFPLHYVHVVQEMARDLEESSRKMMSEITKVSPYGSFPVLVVLARDYALGEVCLQGVAAVQDAIHRSGLDHPFLVSFE